MLAPAACFAVCDWAAVATGNKKLEYAFKPLTLVSLIAVALYAGLDERTSSAAIVAMDTWTFILAALVLSLLGDIFLMLPSDRFVAGLAAFLVAHVCYIAAFADSFRQYRTYAVAVVVAFVSTLLFLRVRRGIVEKRQTRLLVPVTLYVIAISVMATAAIGSVFTPGPAIEGPGGLDLAPRQSWLESASTAAAVGAVLFYVSDAMIGWSRFVEDFVRARLAIMVTYHLGQTGFVLFLLRS